MSRQIIRLAVLVSFVLVGVGICVPDTSIDGTCVSAAATIQLGINAANLAGGDTVLVGPGLYAESPTIDRPLTLQATVGATEADAGNSGVQAIIDGSGAENTLTVSSGIDGVVIDGFEITNPTHSPVIVTSPAGIIVQTDSGGGSTVTIDIINNVIHEVADPARAAVAQSFGEAGILAFNIGGGSTISGNTIYDILDSAPPTGVGESPGSGRAQAILVKSSNGTASGVTIDGNVLHDIQDVAIRFNGVSGTTSADVTNNTVETVGSAGTGFLSGIAIDHFGAGTVSNNRITTITGGFGLGIQASGTTTVSGNSLIGIAGGNGITFPGAAILVNTDLVAVTDNYVGGSAIGIVIGAVVTPGPVNANCIEGNVTGLVNAISGAGPLDATGNWWGDASGPSDGGGCPGCPGMGDSIVNAGAPVTDFSGFTPVPICDFLCSLERYADPTGSDTTNDCVDPSAPCATIQRGVDLSCPGGTVNAATGTYDEQVVIGESVTVLGAGIGSTIIEPTSVSANTTHLVSGAPIAAIVLVDGTSGVTVTDLTVDGTSAAFGSCSPGYMGIYYRNASGTIDTTEVLDVFHPSAGGCQQVVGILVQSGGAGTSTVSILGSTVSNYGKNGITCNEDGTTCTVTGNTVIGRGPVFSGDAAQNGIQFGVGAVGSAIGNDVRDNNYRPMSYCSAGILVHKSDGIIVRNNTLSGSLCDLLAQETNGSTFEGNVINAALEFPFSVIGHLNTVKSNIVTGSVYDGMFINGVNNDITCNRLTFNGGAGIFFYEGYIVPPPGSPNTANMNSIFGNFIGVDATFIPTFDPMIDATNNWWGCVGGPGNGGCDTAVGHVDFSSPADTPPACVSCGSDPDCDDGLTCTGTDTCNTGTAMCEAATPPVDCSAQCLTGTCEEPSGTCEPSLSLTPCDSGDDTCSELDTCDGAGTCDNTGGGGDAEPDLTCELDDNCPGDSNADQADQDNDGDGDVCDIDDAAGMSLRKVVVRKSLQSNRDVWRAVGDLDTTSTPTFETALLSGGATVILRQEGTAVEVGQFSFDGGECQNRPRVILCKDTLTRSVLRVRRRLTPDFYKVVAIVKRQFLNVPTLAETPLTVSLQTNGDGIDRLDAISACKQPNVKVIRCVETQ
jgi:hypothetical protein